jgi:hypothetical protein
VEHCRADKTHFAKSVHAAPKPAIFERRAPSCLSHRTARFNPSSRLNHATAPRSRFTANFRRQNKRLIIWTLQAAIGRSRPRLFAGSRVMLRALPIELDLSPWPCSGQQVIL